ncbi:DUF732 domain-containing protein [Mycobacterium sp. 663a-19]|uniref:DUF732 domain-containing protein n=1 Tax=Mycobacterium sp. 663a-19 TaxID=2986148 RepID=UPI002D1F8C21|nr:DUF732 domain-containing protein [Mycobacterium sp. 663a-19]MEB3981166.1 DUF732 domain-containing protein [Mycobacterium sp. 663a-19]
MLQKVVRRFALMAFLVVVSASISTAHAEGNDELFLNTLANNHVATGHSDAEDIAAAHKVCQGLAQGIDKSAITQVIRENYIKIGYSPIRDPYALSNFFVQESIKTYCYSATFLPGFGR